MGRWEMKGQTNELWGVGFLRLLQAMNLYPCQTMSLFGATKQHRLNE